MQSKQPGRTTFDHLFVAEKPSVARAIAAELGNASGADGYVVCGHIAVTWCFGHMLELAEPDAYTSDDVERTRSGRKRWRVEDLPIVPEHWISVPRRNCAKQLATVGRLLRASRVVVHAGDPDREGQLLVDEVLEHFGFAGEVRRFWVSAQDSTSIRRGLQSLADNARYASMGAAARARQRADWLVGMNLSRAYTLRAARGGSAILLTVGRVQTPTLALVVERDRQIESFEPQPYFVVHGFFEHAKGLFSATWQPQEEQTGLDPEGRLVDRRIADELVARIAEKPAQIESYKTERKSQPPPLGFSLADLTVVASHRLGLTAEQTLATCQQLYEVHKLTSYPRTDCTYLPVTQHVDASGVLAAVLRTAPALRTCVERADPNRRSRIWNDAKVTAHHAIVPTMKVGDWPRLTATERALYDLIARRYIAQFHPDHEFLRTTVRVEVMSERFGVTSKTVVKAGWREVSDDREAPDVAPRDGEADAESGQALPAMAEGDAARCRSATRKDALTKPAPRFTDGSLTRAMEQIHKWVQDAEHKKLLKEGDGIGTAATRASILSDLKRRGFLAQTGKHLISTPLGRALIDALPAAVCSPTLTALFERMLRDIEHNGASVDAFVLRQAAFVVQRVREANEGAVTIATTAPAARRRVLPARRPRGCSSTGGTTRQVRRGPARRRRSN